MVEEVIERPASSKKNQISPTISKPIRLDEVSGEIEERWDLDMSEFARVLGGGIVPGSIVLLGGDPGIGKSTLMLQVSIEKIACVWG